MTAGPLRRFVRLSLLSAVVFVVGPRPRPAAAVELDLAGFLSRFAASDPVAAVAAGTLRAAEADVAVAGTRPNPGISWQRAHIDPAGEGAPEDDLVLTVPLDLFDPTGRRESAVAAATAGLEAARARTVFDGLESRAAAAVRYFEVVHRCARAASATTAATGLAKMAADVRARANAGDVAPYDAERLEIEAATVVDDGALDAAACQAGRRALGRAIGEASVEPTTPLLPPATGPVVFDVGATVASHPRVVAARAEVRAAERSVERARAGWFPELRFSAGARRAESAYGYVAGVDLDLPLSERSPGETPVAAAGLVRATAEVRRVERTVAMEVERTSAELEARRGALARATERLPRVEALLPRALSAWQAGERPIAELLDAWHLTHEARLRVLDSGHAARQAMLEHLHASGRAPEEM
jgi:outer membrane protein TolC